MTNHSIHITINETAPKKIGITDNFDNVQVCGERTVEKELTVSFVAPTVTVTEGDQAALQDI